MVEVSPPTLYIWGGTEGGVGQLVRRGLRKMGCSWGWDVFEFAVRVRCRLQRTLMGQLMESWWDSAQK